MQSQSLKSSSPCPSTRPQPHRRLRPSKRHARTLTQLEEALGETLFAELSVCAERVYTSLPFKPQLRQNTVLAMYGGGKDSSFMTAAVRTMQLMIADKYGSTFTLRVATMRHAGMPMAVQNNMSRVYKALDMLNDPVVQLLVIDGKEVSTFDANAPIPQTVRDRNALDVLMSGHRCHGEARPTFCNACNLAMQCSVAVALGHESDAHIVVTGDSREEQMYYAAWVRHLAKGVGSPAASKGRSGFVPFMHQLDDVGRHLNNDLFPGMPEEVEARALPLHNIVQPPLFFSVYDDVDYEAGAHWEFLTGFLGFKFDEIAFSFTESDCGNPGLMAHLHGLRAEHLRDEDYAVGMREYADYGLRLMATKKIPSQKIEDMRIRYAEDPTYVAMRASMNRYAHDSFGLSEVQLVCMVYSPFTECGAGLGNYVARELPTLVDSLPVLHVLLSDKAEATAGQLPLVQAIERASGLQLRFLRALYGTEIVDTQTLSADSTQLIEKILRDDLHKEQIVRLKNGIQERVYISGR